MLDTEGPRRAVVPAPATTPWLRIDPESRRRITSFCTRLAMMLGMLVLISLPGRRSTADMLALLQSVMFFAALWSALFAWMAREPMQPDRLNLWDETLAFCALFLAVRVVRAAVFGI
jgi:hypothetical protein